MNLMCRRFLKAKPKREKLNKIGVKDEAKEDETKQTKNSHDEVKAVASWGEKSDEKMEKVKFPEIEND